MEGSMKTLRMMALILVLLQVLTLSATADVIEQTYEHKLGMSQGATSWEHRIDLPENLAAQGYVFHKRSFTLSGRMVVENEELTKTYYYVKVRLPKAQLLPMKGAITVSVESTQTPAQATILPAPTNLNMTYPAEAPGFIWESQGKFTNITLLDRATGKTIWERVLVGVKHCHLDEDRLYLYRRYIWAVRQSDETAAWGPSSEFRFRTATKVEICPTCHGVSSQPICPTCQGTGQVTVPAIYLDN